MNETVLELDREVIDLETLKSRCLGNLDLVERVINKFTVQLDADLDKLEEALSARDTATFASVAHRIKGMSANVEARSLHTHAVRAEECARQDALEGLETHLAQMQDDRTRLTSSFAKLKPAEKQNVSQGIARHGER